MITAPVAVQYIKLQDDDYFRRDFNSVVAAHPGDFLSPDDDDFLLTDVPVFEAHAFDRTVENRLFPGVLALVFGGVGIVVVVRGLRRRGQSEPDEARRWRSQMTLLIVAAGLVSVLLAFGDYIYVSGRRVKLPFGFFRDHVPGFSGIRATSRFVVLGQCARRCGARRSACARCSLDSVAARPRSRSRSLCVFLVAETARSVPLVRVPDGTTVEAADALIARRPWWEPSSSCRSGASPRTRRGRTSRPRGSTSPSSTPTTGSTATAATRPRATRPSPGPSASSRPRWR